MSAERSAGAGRTAMLIAFGCHNAEEIAFSDHGSRLDPRFLANLGLSEEDYRADRMSIATALLSAVVTCATHSRGGRARRPITAAIAIASAGALSVNAAGHLLQALVRRNYNPGLVTAPLLLMSSIAAIRGFRADSSISSVGAGTAVVAGTALSVPAIVASLRVARLVRPTTIQTRKESSL
ncbi:HXXEE domain-containing protein [Leucobacter chromiireducens]|uniref:HXXEE domain-containing protein n=1 Tax=Leucobacter chromiireducens subsp. chromiireducens TaxID=660067 RepID=A0ABS1SMY8_9MICO|nr:HXXEE domain-containing protein [Leucobacter chromiireducens]MBL3689538.1 HXXEE domain-containing protein [Leucobacter chromiireducens subsp. chromiireducens]